MTEFDKYLSILKKALPDINKEFKWFSLDSYGLYASTEEPINYNPFSELWIPSTGKWLKLETTELPKIEYKDSVIDRHLIQAEIYMDNFEAKIKPKTSSELLQRAIDLQAERGKQYDSETSQERSMASIIQAFNAITGRELTESEGWLLMVLLKAKRAFTNTKEPHRDSFEDLISYASLMGECALQEEKKL